jgi:hypothetical protein
MRILRSGPLLARRLRAGILVLAAASAALLATPATSYAAANPGFVTVPVSSRAQFSLTAALPASFAVGDCVAYSGSSVELHRPGSDNTTFLTWHQWSYTNHTNNFDQWHVTFRFLDRNGYDLLEVGPLDGSQMRHAGQVYEWTVPSGVVYAFDSGLYDAVTQVQWEGHC